MHQPVYVTLCLVVSVLNKHASKVKLSTINALSSKLDSKPLRATHRSEELDNVTHLGVEVRLELWQSRCIRVQALE